MLGKPRFKREDLVTFNFNIEGEIRAYILSKYRYILDSLFEIDFLENLVLYDPRTLVSLHTI